MSDETVKDAAIAVAEHVRALREGAERVRQAADRLDHQRLIDLVANWIDAEALIWETADQYVRIVSSLKINSERRGGKIDFTLDESGELQCRMDTSEHAKKIIAEASTGPNVPSSSSRGMGGDLR
ncbi:hypothetical protein [Gordonia terrae]